MMADEEMQDTETPQTVSTSSVDGSEDEEVELLVTGRERRKTAGNRYNRDAALEEAAEGQDEDEVALLFAEQDGLEDEEFKSEASDEDDMSSSDDDDRGPNAAAEDLDGEKELQKQAKDDRAKKRKADLALTTTAGLRKRPRIDPTGPKATPKKPSKKKERVTWLPDPDNANARSSLRKQTIAHRAHTLARLKESEAQSKKYKALKEKRDREKAKDAPKAMTQADRLAEAERTERRNAKSLNRWEAMEKRRNEEQAAKLAALKNRKLEGPVISWRSGKEKYRGPKYPPPMPRMEILIEDGPKKRGRKSKAFHEQQANMREAAIHNNMTTYPPPTQTKPLQFQQQLPPMQQAVQQSPQTWLGPPPPPSGSLHYHSAPQAAYQFGQPHPPPQITHPYHPPQPPPSTVTGAPEASNTRDSALNSVDPQPPPSTITGAPKASDAQSSTSNLVDPQPPQPATEAPIVSVPSKIESDGEVSQQDPPQPSQNTAASNNPFLFGIHEYASMQAEPAGKPTAEITSTTQPPDPAISGANNKDIMVEHVPQPPISAGQSKIQSPAETHRQDSSARPVEEPTVAVAANAEPTTFPHAPQSAPPPPTIPYAAPADSSFSFGTAYPPPRMPQIVEHTPRLPTPPSPEVPMEEGFMTRNLLLLDDFDELNAADKHTFGVFFNTRRSAKPSKHNATLCPITMMPAKYRDPATGIGYANLYAYKVLQELKQHKFAWSSILGCYIGRDGAPIARGCPEGFLAK